MTDTAQFIEVLDARVQRRNERRDLFKAVLGAAAVGTGAFVFASAAQAQTVTDADVLNFALNLEYLEAQFYSYALNGTGGTFAQTGTGTQGGVVLTGTRPPRAVVFTGEPVIQQYAREIAADEAAHVTFLRSALGTAAVAQPAINISGGLNADGTPGAFSAAARASGIATTTGLLGAPTDNTNGTFDPYSSPDAFLLGSFIFEDVGVTAYKGAAPLLTNLTFLDAAAGILAVEAYHAAIVRTALYSRGVATPALRTATEGISNARDLVDGAPADDLVRGIGADDDQGVASVTISGGTASNIVPLNSNGLAYSRSAAQTLNVVYLNRAAVTAGGFFPAGVNGTIRASANNA